MEEQTPTVERDGAQVVVLGNFNPAIFSPAWFAAHGLIGEELADDAVVQIIMPRLASFRVGWLICQVQDDRLTLGTEAPEEFETLRDAAIGVLSLLPYTPISSMGLNRYFDISYPHLDSWHRIGDKLAPKEFWEDVLRLPGMSNVTVVGVREDDFAGTVNVTVQPSNLVRPGIFVSRNDHYVLRRVESQPSNRNEFALPKFVQDLALEAHEKNIPLAIEILSGHWVESMRQAKSVADKILTLGRHGS